MKNITIATLLLVASFAGAQVPAATRANNPNYPKRNPFYFEGKIQWELLGIDNPINEWEYVQRGIRKQDDLEDTVGAIADYRAALATNGLTNSTCQIIKVAAPPANLTPPPCMFTPRLRLGVLLMKSNPIEALSWFREVLLIDPLRLEVSSLIGEALYIQGNAEKDKVKKEELYHQSLAAFKTELALSPVSPLYIQLTGDEANNSRVHWAMAEVYEHLDDHKGQAASLQLYLKATKWHSDTYPWRIQLANARLKKLGVDLEKEVEPVQRNAVKQ